MLSSRWYLSHAAVLLALANAALVLALSSTAAAAPTGPLYPLPGNATTGHGGNTCLATDTSAGSVSGLTWTFGGGVQTTNTNKTCPTTGSAPPPFNTNRFQNLYWGSNGGAGKRPQVSMDGPVDVASETLSFLLGESNRAQGKLTWGGTTHMPSCSDTIGPSCSGGFTNFTVDTRFVLTITSLADAPVRLLEPTQAGIGNVEVGGVVSVTPSLRNFKAKLKVLARIQGAATFEPADVLYKRYSHPDVANLYRSSFDGAFWYVDRPPLANFTYSPGTPKAYSPVTFTAVGISDPDGSVRSLGWDFNADGQYQESTVPTTQWSFAAGHPPARLRVVDNEGSVTVVEKILNVLPVDNDGDGYFLPADCDDANPSTHPNAPEVPNNDVDENCDGIKAFDRDGDKVLAPPAGPDCDDNNARVHPGAVDIPGNALNEDCVDGPAKPERINSSFSYVYDFPSSNTTRLLELKLKDIPTGSKVVVRCKGKACPRGLKKLTKRKARGKLNLKRFATTYGPGALIEARVTKPLMIGAVNRMLIRKGKRPKISTRCLPLGSNKPSRCRS